jgi:hypothetical protein
VVRRDPCDARAARLSAHRRIELPRSKLRDIESLSCEQFQLAVTPNVFIGSPGYPIRLDSRLKDAGITEFGLAIYLPQQAAGNEPSAIQTN